VVTKARLRWKKRMAGATNDSLHQLYAAANTKASLGWVNG
jgi:hypothetical protein